MPVIKDLIQGGLEGILGGAKGIIQTIKADPTKVIEAEAKLKELELNAAMASEKLTADIEQAYLKDSQNARDANARIQESEKASWLAKNLAYLIDSITIIAFLFMLYTIMYQEVPEKNKELFYTGFGLLGSYVGQCISFHRGSSAGSHAKQKSLDKMIKDRE